MSERRADDPYPRPESDSSEIAETAAEDFAKEQRYRRAADLLRDWMGRDDGYDDEVWPLVRDELAGSRTHC